MEVNFISTLEDLDACRADWEALFAVDPDAHGFLSFVWIRRWLQRQPAWLVMAARHEGQHGHCAFLPLQLRVDASPGHGLFNTITLGGSPYSGYCGLLASPGDAFQALQAFAASLQDNLNWTSLNIDNMPMAAARLNPFFEAFPRSRFVAGEVERPEHITGTGDRIDHDTFVYVPLAEDYETFLSERLGARTRRHARKALRMLEDPELELDVTFPDVRTLADDVDAFCELWSRQWMQKMPGYGRFIIDATRHMLPACVEAGLVHMPILRQAGKPVAAFVLLLDPARRTVIGFLSGRDQSLDRSISPGLILHCHSIRWAIENGYTTYDLGTGDYGYKDSFGARHHIVRNFRISTRSRENIGGRLDPRTLELALARTLELCRQGKLHLAAQCCRQILDAAPSLDAARRLSDEIEKAGKAQAETRFSQALDHLRSGALAQAERSLFAVLEVSGEHFEALHCLAQLKLRNNEPRAALEHIERAISIDPHSGRAHFCRGNALVQLSRFPEALESYDEAVTLDDRHAAALNNRGTLLHRLGRLHEAAQSYERALAANPDFTQALHNLQRVRDALSGA